MIDRPDWNFDNSGNVPAPAAPASHQELVTAIANDPGPVAAPVPAPPVPAKKNFSGLPDWGPPATRQLGPKDWDYDNQGNERPRNEAGQYITASDAEMRKRWSKEGGLAHVAQTVMRKEAVMLSVAPSLEAKIATLDKNFLMKAVDHLRLSPGHGPEGFWRSVEQFENSLSPSEREAWARFCRSLDEDEQAALYME